jgi:hypothetical protein
MDRYKPIALFAGILIVANAIATILTWHRFGLSDGTWGNVDLAYLCLVVVVMAVATYWWTVRYPSSRASADIGLILLITGVVMALIMPYLGHVHFLHHHHYVSFSTSPFVGGAGDFFERIWIYLAASLAGIIMGSLTAMALGRDYRAKQLKRFAQQKMARPVRTVRR